MADPSDAELVRRWKDEPAPLLPLLHAFHDRDGYVSDEAIRSISSGLKTPLADLFGTVTFYHHLSRKPGGLDGFRVCTGPICALRGARELCDALDGVPMACAGRCDEPVPVIQNRRVLVGTNAGHLREVPTPLPADNPGGREECVFRQIRAPNRSSLDGYRATRGYDGLRRAVVRMKPAEVVARVTESGLTGRGGAGFPTGPKWNAVSEAASGPKTVVCNADEGEPGCFKDRALLDYDPHAVLEGMAIAAYATGATRGFIYLRYEYPQTLTILECAIEEAEAAGLLGDGILGTDFDFRIHIRRGGGAYVCGEEGSLLNSLEGRHPFPRNRPPYPVTHGFENLPTAVNNVETLAAVPQIIRKGADWYRNLGLNDQPGTKVISLSGDIANPGNYEVPFGLPVRTLLYDWGGGAPNGRNIQAVTMAGLSGGFVAGEALEATLDEPSLQGFGSFLGAGGVIVFDDSRDMIEVAHDAMAFFADESCGKCFPCRIGTRRLVERLNGVNGPERVGQWRAEVHDIGETMMATSACGLGTAAPLVTESLMKYFPDQVERHVSRQ
ncbi:MAG: NAD(P)H-dependent oxidoreductase subunit E [Gemmatimonadota bacterium]|nr:NAD(P)H-dependent oxidoreductase subunit E [Gemmatimonadota bacterium]